MLIPTVASFYDKQGITTNILYFKIRRGQIPMNTIRTIPKPVSQIGFWSAVLATLFSIGYGITLIVMMISSVAAATETQVGWSGIESFVASFQPIQMLPLIPSLLLAPTFIVLMVSIHYYAAPDKKIWSHLLIFE
jgi:hypothetical protein